MKVTELKTARLLGPFFG